MSAPHSSNSPASILSFAKDLPNICSLAGLLCAVLAIYYAVLGIFPAAMIGLIWAVFFDWSDGIIARRLKGRNDKQREFGETVRLPDRHYQLQHLPGHCPVKLRTFQSLVPAGSLSYRSDRGSSTQLFQCLRPG